MGSAAKARRLMGHERMVKMMVNAKTRFGEKIMVRQYGRRFGVRKGTDGPALCHEEHEEATRVWSGPACKGLTRRAAFAILAANQVKVYRSIGSMWRRCWRSVTSA